MAFECWGFGKFKLIWWKNEYEFGWLLNEKEENKAQKLYKFLSFWILIQHDSFCLENQQKGPLKSEMKRKRAFINWKYRFRPYKSYLALGCMALNLLTSSAFLFEEDQSFQIKILLFPLLSYGRTKDCVINLAMTHL